MAGKRVVHVVLTDYQFARVERRNRPIPAGVSGPWSTSIEFPRRPRGCRAFVQLRAAGKMLDRDSLVLGKQARRGREPAPAHRAPLPNGVTASALLIYEVPPPGLDVLARVGRGMDQALFSGNQVVEIQLPGRTWSPCRACISRLLDRILIWRKRKGSRSRLRPGFWGTMPRLAFAHAACYEDGSSTFIGGSHFTPARPTRPSRRPSPGCGRPLAAHCRHHPALSGYLIVGPSLDLGYWHNGLLHQTDYAPDAVASYQHYLRDVRR